MFKADRLSSEHLNDPVSDILTTAARLKNESQFFTKMNGEKCLTLIERSSHNSWNFSFLFFFFFFF
jgi:hypothetical protein